MWLSEALFLPQPDFGDFFLPLGRPAPRINATSARPAAALSSTRLSEPFWLEGNGVGVAVLSGARVGGGGVDVRVLTGVNVGARVALGLDVGLAVGGIPPGPILTANAGERGNPSTASDPAESTASLASGRP